MPLFFVREVDRQVETRFELPARRSLKNQKPPGTLDRPLRATALARVNCASLLSRYAQQFDRSFASATIRGPVHADLTANQFIAASTARIGSNPCCV